MTALFVWVVQSKSTWNENLKFLFKYAQTCTILGPNMTFFLKLVAVSGHGTWNKVHSNQQASPHRSRLPKQNEMSWRRKGSGPEFLLHESLLLGGSGFWLPGFLRILFTNSGSSWLGVPTKMTIKSGENQISVLEWEMEWRWAVWNTVMNELMLCEKSVNICLTIIHLVKL